MSAILEKVLRLGEGRILKKLSGIAQQVNALEDAFESLTDAELREETDRFKARLAEGGRRSTTSSRRPSRPSVRRRGAPSVSATSTSS